MRIDDGLCVDVVEQLRFNAVLTKQRERERVRDWCVFCGIRRLK